MSQRSDYPNWLAPLAIIATGIIVAGIGDFLLSQAGYDRIGAIVWALGYGSVIIAVWAIWFRGQEFSPD